MTKVMIQQPFTEATRALSEEVFVVGNPQTNEIYKYADKSYEGTQDNTFLSISDLEELKRPQTDIELRYDLIDTEINICAAEVIGYFDENFDYETLKSDFINNLLESEIVEDKMHYHEIKGSGYYALVNDPRVYQAVSYDIISRSLYPYTMDNNILLPKGSNYHSFGPNQYKEDKVQIDFSSNIQGSVVIGRESKIGADSTIKNTTIGKKCEIGKNVLLEDCFLWDGVIIQDNVAIKGAMICDKSVVKQGTKVNEGSILSFNTQIVS